MAGDENNGNFHARFSHSPLAISSGSLMLAWPLAINSFRGPGNGRGYCAVPGAGICCATRKCGSQRELKMRGNRLTLDSSNRPGRHDAGRNEAWKGGMSAAKQSRRWGRIQPLMGRGDDQRSLLLVHWTMVNLSFPFENTSAYGSFREHRAQDSLSFRFQRSESRFA